MAASNETKYATVFVALVTVSSFPILSGILIKWRNRNFLIETSICWKQRKTLMDPCSLNLKVFLVACPSSHISKSQQANWWEEDEAHLGPSAWLLPRLGTHPGLTPAPPCKDLTGSAEAPILLEGWTASFHPKDANTRKGHSVYRRSQRGDEEWLRQGADKKDGGLGDGDCLWPSPLQRGTSDLVPTARKCCKRKTPSSSDYSESEGEGERHAHMYSGLFYKAYFI